MTGSAILMIREANQTIKSSVNLMIGSQKVSSGAAAWANHCTLTKLTLSSEQISIN